MDEPDDPRVYFAAERTMLAWLRTGITVMGLGFLVARFGMFLRMVRGDEGSHPIASSVIGIAFVVLGTVMVALAAILHRQFVREFRGSFPPTTRWPALGLWISGLIVISGAALALYLAANVVDQ